VNKGLIGFAALAAMLGVAAASQAATSVPKFPDVPPPPPEPPAPTPSSTGKNVSVRIPAGFRRLTQGEVTSALTDTAVSIFKLGDPPGTFYPFDSDGMHYGAGVEMSNGRKSVALFVEM